VTSIAGTVSDWLLGTLSGFVMCTLEVIFDVEEIVVDFSHQWATDHTNEHMKVRTPSCISLSPLALLSSLLSSLCTTIPIQASTHWVLFAIDLYNPNPNPNPNPNLSICMTKGKRITTPMAMLSKGLVCLLAGQFPWLHM
jgi:hypothetical protein